MNIILGASGQVGSQIVADLTEMKLPVRAIIRDEKKADKIREMGAEVFIANNHNVDSLIDAFRDGETIFVLTPESGEIENILGDTERVLENYQRAIALSSIKKLVGLSSMGAEHAAGTGNLLMSYMLEHAFVDMNIEKTFIRPAYYFSNWLPYLDTVKNTSVLPTFYPEDLKIPMISPWDVARFLADTIAGKMESGKIYELQGPDIYSSADVAKAFSDALGIQVKAKQIPRKEWEQSLQNLGFSKDGIENFIEMTEVVISGKTQTGVAGTVPAKGETSLTQYIKAAISK